MSAYKEIKTQFKTLASLLAALKDLGYEREFIQVAENARSRDLVMDGYAGRTERVGVRLPLRSKQGAYEDVGFFWNGQAYAAIVSTHDYGTNFGQQKLTQLTQRYAFHEAKRVAKAQGYTIQELTPEQYKAKHGVYPTKGSVCMEVVKIGA